MSSWKTAAAGIMAFVVALGTAAKAMLDDDPSTVADWNITVATLFTMIGLITARDNSVPDEEAVEPQVLLKAQRQFGQTTD
jgi:hypothetical protein